MIDAATVDITHVSGPSYFQEYRDKGQTPMGSRGHTHHREATNILTHGPAKIAYASRGTPTAAELRSASSTNASLPPDFAADDYDVVADAREARTALLVKKYVGKSTKEDNARLSILTQRIRRLSPRVSEAEVSGLAAIVDYVESSSNEIDDLESRYGI